MKTILEQLTEKFEAAFAACGYDAKFGKVGLSNRPDLCEYQCNGAMAAAKQYKKPPFLIADEVVAKVPDDGTFSMVESVKPGFINLKVSPAFLDRFVNAMAAEEALGVEKEAEPKTIIVDYGGANVAKPLHVGHLRPALIGESIKRICRFMGNHVIGDVHLGDWGLQMGLVIEGLRDRKPDLVYFDEAYTGEYPKEAPFTIAELEEIYPAASLRSKSDEEFARRAHEATYKLQNGDPACRALWQHIMHVSVADLEKNYRNLNVQFDLWNGESTVQDRIPGMLAGFEQSGVAYESQGALVIDVAEPEDAKEIPPCIVRKQDGASLYATSDLATILEREELYHPKQYVYITDKRQDMYFVQIFRAARKAGLVSEEVKLDHIGHGTMNGKDGKPFKTRDGGVMRLENLISMVSDAVLGKIEESHKNQGDSQIPEAEARETARKVGLAALQYGDLSNQAYKDYVFDLERFASFEGNTGPYILYTIVRIKSILNKYAETGLNANDYCDEIRDMGSESEKALKLEMAKIIETMDSAYQELAPHKICAYIYDLSNAFNRFYHENKIMAEEDKGKQASYIRLIELTKRALLLCTDLLGMECPERM